MRWLPAAVVVAVALSLGVAPAHAGGGSAVRDRLAGEADRGLQAASARWGWNGWYDDVPGVPGWAPIWDTQQLFEAYLALERAEPSVRNRSFVIWFAAKSEQGYYNPRLGNGVGGFSTGYGHGGEQGQQWFDDNGWLGLSFVDAYVETGLPRFLRDAEIAFRYLYVVGRDRADGGIWWNTQHTVDAAESVNTAALLAVRLWELRAGARYLAEARGLIGWADAHLLDRQSGLYVNHPLNGVPISYLESPMLSAFARLCQDRRLYCGRVGPLTRAVLAAYGGDLHQAPEFDATYVRYLLDAYELTHDRRLYAVAYANAVRIERNAVDADGFYSKAWDGSTDGTLPSFLPVDASALEVLAWTAVETAP